MQCAVYKQMLTREQGLQQALAAVRIAVAVESCTITVWIKHIINNIISNNIRFYEQRTTNTTCKHKSKQQKSILYYSTRIPECVQHLHDNNQSPVAALRSNSSCANMPWGAASSVGAAPQGARFTPSMLIHVACVNRCRQSMRWPVRRSGRVW